MAELTTEDYLATHKQLKHHGFPRRRAGGDPAGYLRLTGPATTPSELYALDCEMVETKAGRELARVSIVNGDGHTVLDELVLPEHPVTDYLTPYSGISEARLEGVTTRLAGVHSQLQALLPANCILVGHSLEHDLHALKLVHERVLDTALLYTVPSRTVPLHELSRTFLGRIIQNSEAGHSSVEDAVASLELARLVMEGLLASSSKHQRALGDLAAAKPTSTAEPLHCSVCLTDMDCTKAQTEHLQSARHGQAAALFEAADPGEREATYECEVCVTPVRDILRSAHEDGKGHRRRKAKAREEAALRQGHDQADVPEARWQAADRAVDAVFRPRSLSTVQVQRRLAALHTIERLVRKRLPGARLRVFGSTGSGFGSQTSDMDISLSVVPPPTSTQRRATAPASRSDPAGPEAAREEILRKLRDARAGLYRSRGQARDITLIGSARVPILKFMWSELALECDMCVDNGIAVENTRLLHTYATLDPRVPRLGFLLKAWARAQDLNDASRGTFSSYALLMMLVHFLQRCSPAVLPCLQTLVEPGVARPPHTSMEGFSCWFQDDGERLAALWQPANTQSVSALFDGFLAFYLVTFKQAEHVVTVRTDPRRGPLRKALKSRRFDKDVAVEDPFETDHNLTAGVSQVLYLRLLKSMKAQRQQLRDVLLVPGPEQPLEELFDALYQKRHIAQAARKPFRGRRPRLRRKKDAAPPPRQPPAIPAAAAQPKPPAEVGREAETQGNTGPEQDTDDDPEPTAAPGQEVDVADAERMARKKLAKDLQRRRSTLAVVEALVRLLRERQDKGTLGALRGHDVFHHLALGCPGLAPRLKAVKLARRAKQLRRWCTGNPSTPVGEFPDGCGCQFVQRLLGAYAGVTCLEEGAQEGCFCVRVSLQTAVLLATDEGADTLACAWARGFHFRPRAS